MSGGPRNPLKWRGVTTLTMALALLVMAGSGIVLYIAPKCKVAEETAWTALALDKDSWVAFHVTSAITLLIAVSFHLYFNWRVFLRYLWQRSERGAHRLREILAAAAIMLVVLAGTYWRVPPFATVVAWHEDVKASWGEPRDFSGGRHREGRGQQAVPVGPAAEEDAAAKDRDHNEAPGGGGWGRMTLEEACAAAGISLETARANLRAAGIEAGPEDRIKSLADVAGLHPREIVEMLGKAPGN